MRRLSLFPALLILALAAPGGANAAVLDVSAGPLHTCALVSDGTVRCFGDNSYGALGIPDGVNANTPHPTPTIVPLPKQAIKVVTGYGFSCALLVDRTVYCWGLNHVGQTGSPEGAGVAGGFGSPPGLHSNPVQTSFSPGVLDIAAGDTHTCVVLSNGALECVGYNGYGQLGNTTDNGNHGSFGNTAPPHTTPLTTTSPLDAAAIYAGGNQTCALLKSGETKCFGHNRYGQLGHAFSVNTDNPEPTPTTVNFGLGITAGQVGMGVYSTCAVVSGNIAKCWGNNRYGVLGNSTNDDTSAPHDNPTTVPLPAAAAQIAHGYWHTCAVLADGSAYCWGNNRYGELGNEIDRFMEKSHPMPALVPLAGAASKISTGSSHTCALLVNGTLQCWGNSDLGQAGTSAAGGTPTTIGGLEPIVPAPAPSAKKSVSFRTPKFRRKIKGKKLVITGTITPKSAGLTAADCTGRVSLTLKAKKKRIAAKKFSLKFKKRKCSAAVNWKIAKRHKGKKTRLTLALVGSTTLTAKSRTVSLKL